jgi:hypothetical protein
MSPVRPTKATDDLIVRNIVNLLKRPSPRSAPRPRRQRPKEPSRWRDAEISAKVREQIDLLRATIPEFFARDAIIDTRESAQELIDTISKLEHQLNSPPPELRLRLKLDVPLEHHARMTRLLDELKWLTETCKTAIGDTLGPGRKDLIKEQCINSAWALSVQFLGKNPTGSKLSEITSLLYRAVCGEGADMRRLCVSYLKRVKEALRSSAAARPDW